MTLSCACPYRETLDEAREEIRQLRQKLVVATGASRETFWYALKLSPAEHYVLNALYAATDLLSHETLWHGWCARQESRGNRAPDLPSGEMVIVCRLNRKLRPRGILVESIRGRGYRLSPDNKERLSALARPAIKNFKRDGETDGQGNGSRATARAGACGGARGDERAAADRVSEAPGR